MSSSTLAGAFCTNCSFWTTFKTSPIHSALQWLTGGHQSMDHFKSSYFMSSLAGSGRWDSILGTAPKPLTTLIPPWGYKPNLTTTFQNKTSMCSRWIIMCIDPFVLLTYSKKMDFYQHYKGGCMNFNTYTKTGFYPLAETNTLVFQILEEWSGPFPCLLQVCHKGKRLQTSSIYICSCDGWPHVRHKVISFHLSDSCDNVNEGRFKNKNPAGSMLKKYSIPHTLKWHKIQSNQALELSTIIISARNPFIFEGRGRTHHLIFFWSHLSHT